MTSQTAPAFTIPVAQAQTSIAPDRLLHSANSGVIVERIGQLRAEFRSEGRRFGRELADYLNTQYVGTVSVFVYEETFGVKDRLHFLLHLQSLDAYERLVGMGTADAGWRDIMLRQRVGSERGGGTWDRMFLDGGLRERVLLPVPPPGWRPGADEVATARLQTSTSEEQLLHSANCGIVLGRSATVAPAARAAGLQAARQWSAECNRRLAGRASALVYEEAFGAAARIHVLVHLRRLADYHALRQALATEPGAAAPESDEWQGTAVAGSAEDQALTPQHWGMYATSHDGDA